MFLLNHIQFNFSILVQTFSPRPPAPPPPDLRGRAKDIMVKSSVDITLMRRISERILNKPNYKFISRDGHDHSASSASGEGGYGVVEGGEGGVVEELASQYPINMGTAAIAIMAAVVLFFYPTIVSLFIEFVSR